MIDNLISKNDEYVIPSLWIRDGESDRIEKAILNILSQGATCFCIEARPYKNFCKKEWFDDLKIVIDLCKKHNMSFYILDDWNYPTGFANGYIKEHQEYKTKFLRSDFVDTYGPNANRKFKLNKEVGDELISVSLLKLDGEKYIVEDGNYINSVEGDTLYIDIPDGKYRIVFTYISTSGFEKQNFINIVDESSVDILLDQCYEPHYVQFKEYFGNIIRGFFSDEPRFGNGMSKPYYIRNVKIGSQGLAIPFSNKILESVSNKLNSDLYKWIPALWFEVDNSSDIRATYMDSLTNEAQITFSKKIKQWCNSRGVKHIGHVIEDCNAHTRLANGLGHYFRAIDDYDMAGIDIVLCHDLPGIKLNHAAYSLESLADMTFFRYTLPKLCSSSSHLVEGNRQAMCEAFGAYGHGANLTLLKWLSDVMISRGVNTFVLQGYTMREDDIECPPHFISSNPINSHMPKLVKYLNDMCGIFSNGKCKAPVLVVYNAEMDWGGTNNNFNETCYNLTTNQIDFEIVDTDKLENCIVENNKIIINELEFKALVIPQSDYYSQKQIEIFDNLKQKTKVFYSDDKLIDNLRKNKIEDISLETKDENLVYYHYIKDGKDIYLFFNEGTEFINTNINIGYLGKGGLKSVLSGVEEVIYIDNKFQLYLEPFETKVLVLDNDLEKEEFTLEGLEYKGEYGISLKGINDKDFKDIGLYRVLFDVTGRDKYKDFCGFIKYTKDIYLAKHKNTYLRLEQKEGSFEVRVNGKKVDYLISKPYVCDISKYVKVGENRIELIYATTPINIKNDIYSEYLTCGFDGLENCIRIINKD